MATLSREKIKEIIKNAPTGTSPEGIVAALRKEGHILEGFQQQQEQTALTAGNQFDVSPFTTKSQEVATDIIGGGKLAQGLGLSIAAPGIQKGLSAQQRQTEELQNKLLEQIRKRKSEGADISRLE